MKKTLDPSIHSAVTAEKRCKQSTSGEKKERKGNRIRHLWAASKSQITSVRKSWKREKEKKKTLGKGRMCGPDFCFRKKKKEKKLVTAALIRPLRTLKQIVIFGRFEDQWRCHGTRIPGKPLFMGFPGIFYAILTIHWPTIPTNTKKKTGGR